MSYLEPLTASSPRAEVEQEQHRSLRLACDLLLCGVHELRAVNATSRSDRWPHTLSGYFDAEHHAELIEAALRINAPAIYYTLNPVDPQLLGRARNRVKMQRKGGGTTADAQVVRLRTLLVDVDPVRPSGTSATPGQHRASHMLAGAIKRQMMQSGWPEPVYADSGNGAHLLWRVDLEVTEAALIKRVLGAMSDRYSQDSVKVDTSVHNPSRICKMYGTWARKGDDHPDAPHRLSRIITAPEELHAISREQLEAFAPESRVELPTGKRSRVRRAGDDLDVERWAADNGLPLPEAQDFPSSSGSGKRWRFRECPCSRKVDGAAICKAGDGTVSFKCHHNNCGVGSDWKALREHVEPARPRKAEVVSLAQKRREKTEAPGVAAAAALAVEPDAQLWSDRLLVTKEGKVRNSVNNLLLILANDDRWRGVIAMDEMSGRVIKLAAPPWGEHEQGGRQRVGLWTDGDTTALQGWIEREYRFSPGVDRTHACVVRAAEAAGFHPVRQYLKGLQWDGVERLNHWLSDYCHAKRTPYTADVGRWWMIQAVARVMQPGCQADYVLVLEGDQGDRKSTAFRTLCKDHNWFCDTKFDVNSKDALQLIRAKWLVELAEVDRLSKKEASDVKAFLTSKVDSYRPSYGRMLVDVPRQVVFAGTVNPRGGGYLNDPTGARRWWPVKVNGRIALHELEEARDQLWAEAVHRWQAGERAHPHTDEEHARCKYEQGKRSLGDSWDAIIAGWLEVNAHKMFVTAGQLLAVALDVPAAQQDRPKINRVCNIMRNLEGWRAKRQKVNGAYIRGWIKEVSDE